jgi:hypothetical protein
MFLEVGASCASMKLATGAEVAAAKDKYCVLPVGIAFGACEVCDCVLLDPDENANP